MTKAKKLIEVAMPVKEISAESVRDKSIRHGHISTLHLWWARRPLPVCRAVVFASLVPDPLDPHCPPAFVEAVDFLLGKAQNPGDPYQPYDDIPWTPIFDPVADNPRNRLQAFIGKFTRQMQDHLLGKIKKPGAKHQLSDFSLIKWDNKNNAAILHKARQLLFVAHNAQADSTAAGLLQQYQQLYAAITAAEDALYAFPDRHLESPEVQQHQQKLDQAIVAFQERMPAVFDPFAGGGAIPLEAARLGCRSYGNDINPVAHIIQKGSLEFPQRYGKPITYTKAAFVALYGQAAWEALDPTWFTYTAGNVSGVRIPNRLRYDVEHYAKRLIAMTESEVGHYYPPDEQGRKPIAYYWARVGTCANPSCRAEVPLLKQFYLANTKSKKVYLQPIINGIKIDFRIKEGNTDLEGWNNRTNITCPVCQNITESGTLKAQFKSGSTTEKLLAVIEDGSSGKGYRLPNSTEIAAIEQIPKVSTVGYSSKMQVGNNRNFNTPGWGFDDYVQLFTPRQLLMLQTLVAQLETLKSELPFAEDYRRAISTYLAILVDRIAIANTSFGRWHVGRETLEHPFSKQAIPMMFDFPESNPFCDSTGSALNQLAWLIRYIESECDYPFPVQLQNASSGDKTQFAPKSITAVVTDPPYYDAIAYADLSDFFYVWLKRTLRQEYPLNFATPQTPKSEECTALKHHHENDKDAAKAHFEDKLTEIFDAIELQTSDVVSIMFAHQSTEAWTTLCNSILDARMNITGSWPVDTEMANRSLGLSGAVLASSVTVSARPAQRSGYGDYAEVRRAIATKVEQEVTELYALGFRGADLLTACFGQAVSEFGRYQSVEKADGTEVTVAELLEMARESAFNALLKGFAGDDFTKFYIGWLQLYGFGTSEFDDAAKFSRVGLTIDVNALFVENILIKDGNRQHLGRYQERLSRQKNLGEKSDSNLIDQVHRAMGLYQGTNRRALLQHIKNCGDDPNGAFWRVVTALCEVLPKEEKSKDSDYLQATGLLVNKDSLIRESQKLAANTASNQGELF